MVGKITNLCQFIILSINLLVIENAFVSFSVLLPDPLLLHFTLCLHVTPDASTSATSTSTIFLQEAQAVFN